MYDSDLVQTLATLRPDERSRLFIFLNSAESPEMPKTYEETALMAAYIFECLDQQEIRLSTTEVWKVLNLDKPVVEDQLHACITTAVMELKDTLKTVLKKRVPTSQKDLIELTFMLTQKEREGVLSSLKEKKMQEKQAVLSLVSYFCHCHNKHEDALSEAVVYQKIFGDKKQVVGKLPKSRTESLKIIRKFIALETVGQDMTELQEWVILQKFFLNRTCTSQYNRIRNNILRRKLEKKSFSSKDLYQHFLSESLEYDLQNSRSEATGDQNLWETIQSLDEYYLVERLWFTCQLLNINQISPLALPPQEAWWHFDSNSPHLKWFFDKPLGKLFTASIQFLAEESKVTETDYANFIILLRENESNIAENLVTSFEIFAVNHGIRRMNKGKFNYGELVFNIQQHRAGTDRIYDKGVIVATEYQSIVTLGLYLGKVEWVKEFMEKNKNKVEGSMPSEKYYEFCQALYLYKTKDLLSSLHILMNAEYDDLFCKMATRILEIKVLCELEFAGQTKLRIEDQLDARIEAGILFFYRLEEVPYQMRIMRKRFMDFMKKIIRAKENRRWKILEKMKREVAEIDLIAERLWLIQVIDQYLATAKK